MRRLRDAHTRYVPPTCYGVFRMFQPLSLVSFVREGAQAVFVSSTAPRADWAAYFLQQYGLDLSDFAGAQVWIASEHFTSTGLLCRC